MPLICQVRDIKRKHLFSVGVTQTKGSKYHGGLFWWGTRDFLLSWMGAMHGLLMAPSTVLLLDTYVIHILSPFLTACFEARHHPFLLQVKSP